MQLTMTTPPSSEPVTLSEAKEAARIDFDDEDAFIAGLIEAATEHVQAVLGRQLMPATYELSLGGFPSSGRLSLPRAPVTEILSINYRDTDGALQPFEDFLFWAHADGPFLSPKGWWPPTAHRPDAVVVEFVAGFPTGKVPARAKLVILQLVAHWYEHREPSIVGTVSQVPHHITRLINSTRNWAQA